MKNLVLIGGAMGVGKTATSRELERLLPDCAFLDGDWCWEADPFVVTDETKAMVLRNIVFLLNGFLRCGAYKNVVFCWVMHKKEIIDSILSGLETSDVNVVSVSLVCCEERLRERIEKDVAGGVRTPDVMARSLSYLPLYGVLPTKKLDVSCISAAEAARKIASMTE